MERGLHDLAPKRDDRGGSKQGQLPAPGDGTEDRDEAALGAFVPATRLRRRFGSEGVAGDRVRPCEPTSLSKPREGWLRVSRPTG